MMLYPKSILTGRLLNMTRDERRHTLLMYFMLYPAVLVWMLLSAHQAGIRGFWPLFWMAYVEMLLVSLNDLFFPDDLLL